VKTKSQKEFATHYDHIFSNKIVSIIEKQNHAALFANDQGVTIEIAKWDLSRPRLQETCVQDHRRQFKHLSA